MSEQDEVGLWERLNIKTASDTEQHETAFAQMARVYAMFYNELVSNGVPEAPALTITCHTITQMINKKN